MFLKIGKFISSFHNNKVLDINTTFETTVFRLEVIFGIALFGCLQCTKNNVRASLMSIEYYSVCSLLYR